MAASAAPFPHSARWSRTVVQTLFACGASLALHAVLLGGLAWLYHRSLALAPPLAEVRIAAVYLAPAAPREKTPAEAASPAPAMAETRISESAVAELAPAESVAEPARSEFVPPARAALATAEVAAEPVQAPPEPTRAMASTAAAQEPVVPLASVPQAVVPARDERAAKHAPPAPRAGKTVQTRTHAGIEWRVQDWLAQHRRYPRAARRSGAEGTVWVRFVLDRGGSLQGSEVLTSSGHPILDRAALDLLERASPFPALPPELTTDEIELVLPIEYDLTRAGRG